MISAPWGASVSPDAPFASLSLGSLGARWAARFALMLVVSGSSGWRLGGGSRQPSRPIQVLKNEWLSA